MPWTYRTVSTPTGQDVTVVGPYLAALMLRNVSTGTWRFVDPLDGARLSRPGCIIASPSYPEEDPDVDQNYVFNWTRDAALVALEIAAVPAPLTPAAAAQHLADWLSFAEACQTDPTGPFDRGAWLIDATPRPRWSEQADGPALRIVAALASVPALADADVEARAGRVVARDLDYVLGTYRNRSTDPWEEKYGFSLFTRAAQLRALRAVRGTAHAKGREAEVDQAIGDLEAALDGHWDAAAGVYRCVLDAGDTSGRDAAADVVLAAVCGALDPLDPRTLATAARIREQWDTGGKIAYPINADDAARGIGPLIGRYPDDTYDGDTTDDETSVGHPWALTTCAFAELYYRVTARADLLSGLAADPVAAPFLEQAGALGGGEAAAAALRVAGDRMLQAVLFHADHLELSEQFDQMTGFEKSVGNLTWSYAAYLSALRARAAS